VAAYKRGRDGGIQLFDGHTVVADDRHGDGSGAAAGVPGLALNRSEANV
jgi:hypothetical protein